MKQKELFVSLKNKKEISRLFSDGIKFYSKGLFFRVLYIPHDNFLPITVLFAVSKKSGNAVLRNRVKRQLRSALMIALKEVKLKHAERSIILSISPTKEFLHFSFENIVDALKQFLYNQDSRA